MNLYILTEGKTEKLFYPHFINVLAPHLTQVQNYRDVTSNNYYIFSSQGYPYILQRGLLNAIEDIRLHNTRSPAHAFDYLLCILDVDDEVVESRENEFFKHVPNQLEFVCVCFLQNRCIETWFLANKKIVKTHPNGEKLLAYKKFYNVASNDPELMPLYPNEKNHAGFHFKYLKNLLKEHELHYSKNDPKSVSQEHYIQEMIKRVDSSNDLKSLKKCIDFIRSC